MLTRSFAQSQLEKYQCQLKIIKTYYTVKILCQNLTFLIQLAYIYAHKLRESAANPRNLSFRFNKVWLRLDPPVSYLLQFLYDSKIPLRIISCGQNNTKNPIHVTTGMETRTVSQIVLNSNQLPPISVTPVRTIDQG